MNGARRATLSLAGFVLICFFLPWLQLSCVGVRDSVSGFDLARAGDKLLWFLPLSMLLVLIAGLVRVFWKRMSFVFTLVSTTGGSVSAFVMYYERSTTNHPSTLIATEWALFYWLGFVAALGIVVTALIFYSRHARSP